MSELHVKENDAFEQLKAYFDECNDWVFGYLSYDLKNEIERLTSGNFDGLGFPLLHFFQPKYVIELEENEAIIHYHPDHSTQQEADELYAFLSNDATLVQPNYGYSLQHRVTKDEYIETVLMLKEHIQQGDLYEINYCQEFYAENAAIEPEMLYYMLNQVSPSPFSCYYKAGNLNLICASPERFLQKKGNTLISQPIKGTAPRGGNDQEDHRFKEELLKSRKELSENVMTVDLVRNDLSRSAVKASVKVQELAGVYSFPQVHQLISTITCQLRDDVHFIDAIKNAFPMGSMTGTPKIKAMELIEQYETTKRGLYSGAVGYITPDGDFDFNVVIRSILLNTDNRYLSVMAGGAITAASDPQSEYRECLLKARAAFQLLENTPVQPLVT